MMKLVILEHRQMSSKTNQERHPSQGIDKLGSDKPKPALITHPVELLARSYGIG